MVHAHHDLFRWSALGKTGHQVWEFVRAHEHGATVKDIAAGTGRARSTVRRRLKKMAAVGMVVPTTKRRWRLVRGVNLDLLADVLGTKGLGARQRERHKRERRLRD